MKLISIDENGKFLHWVLPNRETPGEIVEVSNFDAFILSQHPQSKWYDKTNKTVNDVIPLFNFSLLFDLKNSEIRRGFSLAMQPITANYTAEDIASFPTQEAEAKAYEADQNASTPLLDYMVANRPSVDKPTLVSRIIANSVNYKKVAGPAIGKKQHYEDLLYALKAQHDDPQQPDVTQADFDAIVVDFS